MLDLIINDTLVRLAFLAIIFAIVAGSAALVLGGIFRRARVVQDIREIEEAKNAGSLNQSLVQRTNHSIWVSMVDRLERTGLSLADTKPDELRKKLILAGYDSPAAPKIFTFGRLVLTLALPGLYLLLVTAGTQPQSLLKLYVICMVLALVGLYLPNLFVTAKADRRREAIVNGFPDALDLLLVCVEAGLGLEAALDRVGREIASAHPLIAGLFAASTLQMRAGASREEALRSMGEASAVDEIRSFSTLLIQSDKLGTSIATTLRVYASEMREKRRLRAEEKAYRLPVLISIPLVTCMLPVTIGVLMLPAVVRVIRQLAPALAGG